MKTATFLLSLATLCTTSAAAQVSTLPFDVPIHQMRIYGDTIFVSSDHAIDCLPLGTNFMPFFCADVVVYDFVKWGNQFIEAGTPTERLSQHPHHPNRVYRSEPLEQMMGYRLSKSDDFGKLWWSTGQELQIPGQPQFAFNPRNDNEIVIYGVDEYVDCICPFLLHSTDGLATFESVDMAFDRQMAYVNQMAFSPTEDHVLLAATSEGMARSEDDGATWTFTTPDYQRFSLLCFDDLHPEVAFAIEDGEVPTCLCDEVEQAHTVYCSTDGGKTWRAIATISTPLTYYQSSRPWRHTGLLQGLTCYYGNLFCWADENVFMVHSPLNLSPNVSLVPTATTSASSSATYSLKGYETDEPKAGEIVIRDKKKYVAK